MKESKININRKSLTDKEIKEDENFENLLKKHSQFKLINSLKKGGTLTVGLFLLIGIILYVNNITKKDTENIGNKNEEVKLKDSSFISPVLTGVPKYKTIINSEKGGEVLFNNSIITIPQNAFIDERGTSAIGNVEISYREFHNPIDFFLSGIPMAYDSADYQYHFESAGMFEIYGYQNNKPVSLVKPITVSLASLNHGDYFNIYELDTTTGVWDFIKKDNTPITRHKQNFKTEISHFNKKIKEIESNKPLNSRSSKGVCIKIDFKKEEFPELNGFKDVLFEIDPTDESFSPDLAIKDWDDIKLKKNNEIYILTFYDKFKPTKLKAKPVLPFRKYTQKLQEYNSKYGDRLSEYRKKRDSLKSLLAKNTNAVFSFGNSTSRYVERLFTINNFGVWNSDCPRRMPKGKTLASTYVNKIEGADKIDTLDFKTVFLVEENKNTLYRLTNRGTLSYNPSKKYVLWAINKKEQLCVFSAQDFKNIPSKIDSTYSFNMRIVDKKITNVADLRKELNLTTLFKTL